MSLEEFYNLANNFFIVAKKYDYPNKVANLRSIVNAIKNLKAASNLTQQQQTALQTHRNNLDPLKKALVESLQSIRNELYASNYYSEYYDDFVSNAAIESINRLDSMTDSVNPQLLLEVDKLLLKSQSFYSFYNSVNSAVGTFDLSHSIGPKEDTLILTFENDAFIDDLRGLKKASEDWGLIIHSFGRLLNENDTKAEVLSIKRGSLILSLAIVRIVLKSITKTSNEICESILKVLQVKQKILEMRQLTNGGSSAELDAIEKKESIKVNALAKSITEKLMEEHQPDHSKTDYHEIEDFVKKSVKKMIMFHTKGGKAEAKLLSPNESEKADIEKSKQTSKKLKDAENIIKSLANGKKILLLDNPDEDDSNEENDRNEGMAVDSADNSEKSENDSLDDDEIVA